MKVKCINDIHTMYLTKDKEYEVEEYADVKYRIINDIGYHAWYKKEHFKEVK